MVINHGPFFGIRAAILESLCLRLLIGLVVSKDDSVQVFVQGHQWVAAAYVKCRL
jgi:hypothetical protein